RISVGLRMAAIHACPVANSRVGSFTRPWIAPFFLLIRRAPRPKRFPYTTLFRSSVGALALVLLWGFAIACFGTLLGVLLRKPTTVQAFGFLVMFPLTFASSTFVPVRTMPAWLQAFSSHSPITSVVDAARHLILNAP